MNESSLRKLQRHIERTGLYPPVIVRRTDEGKGNYEILDGHHRAEALRRLGAGVVRCVVWEVDDEQALILLTTLNRLRGRDDPLKRADLLGRMIEILGKREALGLVPDGTDQVERLLMIRRTEPPAPAAPPRLEEMPEAVTFFLTGAQREQLDVRLRGHEGTRTERLVRHLRLDETL